MCLAASLWRYRAAVRCAVVPLLAWMWLPRSARVWSRCWLWCLRLAGGWRQGAMAMCWLPQA